MSAISVWNSLISLISIAIGTRHLTFKQFDIYRRHILLTRSVDAFLWLMRLLHPSSFILLTGANIAGSHNYCFYLFHCLHAVWFVSRPQKNSGYHLVPSSLLFELSFHRFERWLMSIYIGVLRWNRVFRKCLPFSFSRFSFCFLGFMSWVVASQNVTCALLLWLGIATDWLYYVIIISIYGLSLWCVFHSLGHFRRTRARLLMSSTFVCATIFYLSTLPGTEHTHSSTCALRHVSLLISSSHIWCCQPSKW